MPRRTAAWEGEAEAPPEVAEAVMGSRDRGRDMAVLTMLGQHHYLTTGQVEALFFPGFRHGAQRRMKRLQAWGLVARWHLIEPPEGLGGWRKHDDVFLLTARGAAVLGGYLRQDSKPLIRRAYSAFHYNYHLAHALGSASFFASLVTASRDLPDQGLYYWVGDDGVRQTLEKVDANLAPDGAGHYLTATKEVAFYLEWDVGTEAPQRLADKAAAAVGHTHVLWVAQTDQRETAIRAALAKAGHGWTTHTALLREHGPLGAIWQSSPRPGRVAFTELIGRLRTNRRVEDCLGQPGWWIRRPGGGEGA